MPFFARQNKKSAKSPGAHEVLEPGGSAVDAHCAALQALHKPAAVARATGGELKPPGRGMGGGGEC